MDKPKMYDVCELCGAEYAQGLQVVICHECGSDTFAELTRYEVKNNKEENEKMKQKATHTPGPWSLNDFVFSKDKPIALPIGLGTNQRAFGLSYDMGKEESEANARLIASAPDLLSALVRLVGEARAAGIIPQEDCIVQADAAIRKARGE
jgi:hypothetical protein